MPESKKGLFHSHSATVAAFLKASHIQINARNEDDVEPEVILKRLADSGGAKYSVQQKQASAAAVPARDRIAPVGSAYQPVGKVDMGALKAGKPTTSSSYTPPSFNKPSPAPVSAPAQPARSFAPPPVKAATPPPPPPQATARDDDDDDETWGDEPPAPAAPASKPAPVAAPKASAPAGSFYRAPVVAPAPAKVEVKQETAKPKEDDRIGKVVRRRSSAHVFLRPAQLTLVSALALRSRHQGTAYTPVSLPKPKKLVNPFAAGQAQQTAPASTPSFGSSGGASAGAGGAKLTWSQRQALAKERDAADEAKSQAASATVGKGPLGGVSPAAIGAGVGVALAGTDHGETTSDKEDEPEAPAAPAPPPLASRPLPPRAPVVPADDDDEGFEEPSPPSSPPPPPVRAIVPNAAPAFPDDDDDFDEPTPAPPPRKTIVANAPPAFPDDDEDFDEPSPAPPPRKAIVPNAAPSFPDDDDFADDDDAPAAPPPPPPPAPPRAPSPEPEPTPVPAAASGGGGLKAIVLYDYEATESNEVDLVEGETVHDVDQIDEGWWSVTNSRGKSGLVPANYMELLEGGDEAPATAAPPPPPPRLVTPEPEPEAEPEPASGSKAAVAQYECVLFSASRRAQTYRGWLTRSAPLPSPSAATTPARTTRSASRRTTASPTSRRPRPTGGPAPRRTARAGCSRRPTSRPTASRVEVDDEGAGAGCAGGGILRRQRGPIE